MSVPETENTACHAYAPIYSYSELTCGLRGETAIKPFTCCKALVVQLYTGLPEQ